jgi:hypothetical protein
MIMRQCIPSHEAKIVVESWDPAQESRVPATSALSYVLVPDLAPDGALQQPLATRRAFLQQTWYFSLITPSRANVYL